MSCTFFRKLRPEDRRNLRFEQSIWDNYPIKSGLYNTLIIADLMLNKTNGMCYWKNYESRDTPESYAHQLFDYIGY